MLSRTGTCLVSDRAKAAALHGSQATSPDGVLAATCSTDGDYNGRADNSCMTHRITLIPGDGIGPEVTDAVVQLLARTTVSIEWEHEAVGAAVAERSATPLPQRVLDSITRNRVALKGPVGTPIGAGFGSVNVEIRRSLELYANLRPVCTLPGIATRYDAIDLIVVRENTEDLYSGLEHEVVPGVVESLKIITKKASVRIAKFAFSYARRRGRHQVTAVHKANIMKLSDGLFLDSVRSVARDFDDIEYQERIVDAACMHIVMNPAQFDVLLLPNLYGDIVSDLCAGLVGGLGLVPSANLGDDLAVFEAVHGTAPDIAGQQRANPTALLLSALLMLRYLDEDETAARIFNALEKVLEDGRIRTPDLGGTSSTTEFTDAISRQMELTASQ